MSSDVLASSIDVSQMLLDLGSLNGSEDLALGLEDEKVSLLLDIEDVVL